MEMEQSLPHKEEGVIVGSEWLFKHLLTNTSTPNPLLLTASHEFQGSFCRWIESGCPKISHLYVIMANNSTSIRDLDESYAALPKYRKNPNQMDVCVLVDDPHTVTPRRAITLTRKVLGDWAITHRCHIIVLHENPVWPFSTE